MKCPKCGSQLNNTTHCEKCGFDLKNNPILCSMTSDSRFFMSLSEYVNEHDEAGTNTDSTNENKLNQEGEPQEKEKENLRQQVNGDPSPGKRKKTTGFKAIIAVILILFIVLGSLIGRSAILSKVEVLMSDGNYPEAISELKKAIIILPYGDLKAKLDACCTTYRDSVEKEARTVLESQGYDQAMEVLNAARDVLGDDETLAKLIEEFRGYGPEYLYDIDPDRVISRHVEVGVPILSIWSHLVEDNYGNTYKAEGVIWPLENGSSGYVLYRLGKEYDVLEGDVYVPYISRNVRPEEGINGHITRIRIFGKDDELLYECKQITGMDEPYHFSVNISEVDYLCIFVSHGWFIGDGSVMFPTMCIANLSVSKRG